MTEDGQSAGDSIPPACELIEIYVSEIRQLFNSIDPSPFRQKDLDPDAEQFILDWAREAPREAPVCLLVHLDRPAGLPDEAVVLRDAIREFFSRQAEVARRELRLLFARGRVSLVIGLVCLALSIGVGEALVNALSGWRLAEVARESLLIGGWVAMWRPLEIFLYDWWPILDQMRLLVRLGNMSVRIVYHGEGASDSWRSDWPAVPSQVSDRRSA